MPIPRPAPSAAPARQHAENPAPRPVERAWLPTTPKVRRRERSRMNSVAAAWFQKVSLLSKIRSNPAIVAVWENDRGKCGRAEGDSGVGECRAQDDSVESASDSRRDGMRWPLVLRLYSNITRVPADVNVNGYRVRSARSGKQWPSGGITLDIAGQLDSELPAIHRCRPR